MRSITGVAVSTALAVSVAQPVPTSVRSMMTSKLIASTFTTLAIARIDAVDRSTDMMRSDISGATRNPPSALTDVDSALPSSTRPRSPSSSPDRR